MLKPVTRGVAAISVMLFAAAFAVIADHYELAIRLLVAGGAFGLAAIALHIIGELDFRAVRDGLGEFLEIGDELTNRKTITEDEFRKWRADLDEWFVNVQRFLHSRLSATDAALFLTIAHLIPANNGLFSFRSLSARAPLQDALVAHVATLRTITERFLSRKD